MRLYVKISSPFFSFSFLILLLLIFFSISIFVLKGQNNPHNINLLKIIDTISIFMLDIF